MWSEVERAGQASSPQALAALESLLRKYYRPLQAHLRFKFHVEESLAADWLHEFVHQKVLLRDLLAVASPGRGRFRTFLLSALDNFVLGQMRRDTSQRRRPQGGLISLDDPGLEKAPEPADSQGDPFELEWGRTVVAEAVARMQAECLAKGCAERWGVFEARLLNPILNGAEAVAFETLVAKYGFRSPAEASNVLITAKRHFDRVLRQVVAEYAGDGADVEEEILALKRVLSGS